MLIKMLERRGGLKASWRTRQIELQAGRSGRGWVGCTADEEDGCPLIRGSMRGGVGCTVDEEDSYLLIWGALRDASRIARRRFIASYLLSNKYNHVVWKTYFDVHFQRVHLRVQFSHFHRAGTRGAA